MKVGVTRASAGSDVNDLLFQLMQEAVKGLHEVVNLGMFPSETANSSYVEVAVMVSLLIGAQSLDFMVTGCSSGQGVTLTCNSLPGLRCGFIQTPQDVYLSGRINSGNVVPLSLGLSFGWSGKLNLQCTLDKLFEDEFDCGYPEEDAEHKRQGTDNLVKLATITKRSFSDILDQLDQNLL